MNYSDGGRCPFIISIASWQPRRQGDSKDTDEPGPGPRGGSMERSEGDPGMESSMTIYLLITSLTIQFKRFNLYVFTYKYVCRKQRRCEMNR